MNTILTQTPNDLGSFDNESEIKSLFISDSDSKVKPCALIGSDNKLRIIENSIIKSSLAFSSSPSSFMTYKISSYDTSNKNLFFGTTFGSYGILSLEDEPNILWEENSDKIQSEVISMKSFDINTDGNK